MPVLSKKSGDQDSQQHDYEDIERELKRLLEVLKILEKEAKEKVQKELIPLLKREIERLRKWLEEFRPEKDNPQPNKTWT